ncbi:unnamed protein product [Rhizophagus irregularis]|uniref:Uncharacterized protein n=1 Tax=Rhizophagus irregularis TaxID=588596 RepID=A0A2I1G4W2_9GLOM|nr:hypothetical protein RhiirA4_455228 [Rhizophagus irregularis]CAB4413444.1 unnamed protein product [Rhizophagus irregularis]
MADTQYTKLKYKQGTCFGCRMCLYCGIDLQQKKCKCTITKPQNRGNWTAVIKNAYTRIYNPNWTEDRISFIQEKVSTYKLFTNKSINFKPTSETMQLEPEVYDLTITEKETTLQNSLETTLESDENSEDTSMGDNLKYEFHYGIFIKLNGKL